MRVLSLFDGISCGKVALERAGVPIASYHASEVDFYAKQISKRNHPDIAQLGDIRNVHCQPGQYDLVIGGSPCQGFSNAGDGLAFNDPRSALFFEFVRILNEAKPRWFLLENVKMKQAWQDKISHLLWCKPRLINSAAFSAQNRERLYWTNIPIADYDDCGISLTSVLEEGWVSDRAKSYCLDANYGKGTNFKRYFHRGSRQIVFRQGCVPIRPSEIEANDIQRTMLGDWRKLSPIEAERLQTLPDDYTKSVADFERYKTVGNGWTVDVVAHIFQGLNVQVDLA